MNNKERLKSLLGFAPPQNSIEGALLDAEIDPAGEYVAASSKSIKSAAIEVLKVILATADTVTPEQMSIKYDRSAILKRIAQLEDELGLSTTPAIRARYPW